MAKKRTRKQKERAKHSFTIAWEKVLKEDQSEPVVKSQFIKTSQARPSRAHTSKKALESGKERGLQAIKREIFKSLILASLILGLELMIYLAW